MLGRLASKGMAVGVHRRRAAVAAMGLLVTLVFGYLAVRHVNFREAEAALRRSDYLWTIPSLLTLALSVFLRAIRWRCLFAAASRPRLGAITSAMLVGYFFNAILPLRAGEAARVISLHQRTRTSRAETTGTIVIERVYDVVTLLLILFVALPWLPHVTWIRAAAILSCVLAIALTAAVVVLTVFGDRPVRWLTHPFRGLRWVDPQRLERAALNLTEGLAGLRHPTVALSALFWTVSAWLLTGLSFWFLMLGFHLHLTFGAGLLVAIATGLSMILPSSPGAIGVFEAAATLVLSAYHVAVSSAIAYAIVLHVLNLVPYLVAGLILLPTSRAALNRTATARLDSQR